MKRGITIVFFMATSHASLFLPSSVADRGCELLSQTVLYNGGTDITVDAGAIVYVDGDVNNSTTGAIHNKGDIYLTGNWINNAPSGCLDPTTGTVILDGGAQTIMGGQITTFNNLDCRNGGTKTLNITTIVGGNTGVLSLNNCPFVLNSNKLIVTNPATGAITRTMGYIVSETDPTAGYGTIDWRIGNSTGNYTYPFGTVNGSYIPFLFNITTAGFQSTNGSIALATYPTLTSANPNNRPLPTGVTDLIDISKGMDASALCNDRYWIIDAFNYVTNPTANITFTYLDSEWDNSFGSTNTIVEDSLKAWRWNGVQWQLPAIGNANPTANIVTVNGVNTFSPWTLLGDEPLPPPPPIPCGDFFLPNAFSPNADNKNDYFRPRNNCITAIDFRIYNRWGNLVFETTDVNTKGWNGSTPEGKDANEGVYAYEIKATVNGKELVQKGTVTLMR